MTSFFSLYQLAAVHRALPKPIASIMAENAGNPWAYGKGWHGTPQSIAKARHALPFYALLAATPETAFRPVQGWPPAGWSTAYSHLPTSWFPTPDAPGNAGNPKCGDIFLCGVFSLGEERQVCGRL
jgi:hypothetical protein